jgi:hypothetical protein
MILCRRDLLGDAKGSKFLPEGTRDILCETLFLRSGAGDALMGESEGRGTDCMGGVSMSASS